MPPPAGPCASGRVRGHCAGAGGGRGAASSAGRASVVFVLVVCIYDSHSYRRYHRLLLLRFPLPPRPVRKRFRRSGASRGGGGGGSCSRKGGGSAPSAPPARCGAVSPLLPTPGSSGRDAALLVDLSTTKRWRNSGVCAAEVPVVLLGRMRRGGAAWGRLAVRAAGLRGDGGSPRRHRVGTPPVLMGNRAVANRGISAGPPAGIRREGEGLQPPPRGSSIIIRVFHSFYFGLPPSPSPTRLTAMGALCRSRFRSLADLISPPPAPHSAFLP